ncbi:MAG: ADOP family duplicated permease [Acidobacteriota bacterium]
MTSENLPGRFERWLIGQIEAHVPPDRAEFVAGDLEEEVRRRRTRGRLVSILWLLRQLWGLAWNGQLTWRRNLARSSDAKVSLVGRAGILLDHSRRDLLLGARRLTRTPTTSGIVVATLALGIGLNSLVFMLADTLVLRPLPYGDPERLLSIETNTGGPGWYGSSEPELFDLETIAELEAVAGWTESYVTLGEGSKARRFLTVGSTANLLELLGVPPLRGRLPEAGDDVPGAPPVVVISYSLWQSELGGREDVLGTELRFDGSPLEVVGIMPPGFQYPTTSHQAWRPLQLDRQDPWERNNHYLGVVARRRAEVSLEQARASIDLLVDRSESGYPSYYADDGYETRTRKLREATASFERAPLLSLMAAVGLLLILACANVANVQLGRGVARSKEVSVARALGAGRTRIFSELMVESALLAAAGSAVALALAKLGERLFPIVLPPEVLRLGSPSLDGRVVAFTVAVAFATTVLFGLWPALSGSRAGTRSVRSVGRTVRSRSLLIVSQVAMAAVLLVGCGMVLRSLQNLVRVDPGFETQGAMVLTLVPPEEVYDEPEEVVEYYASVEEALTSLPGVAAAGAVERLPFSGGFNIWSLQIEGRLASTVAEAPSALVQQSTPGTLESLGMRLLSGRFLNARDRAGAEPVVVVNEAFAKEHWPGEDALGHRFRVFSEGYPWLRIVGVVADVRDFDLQSAGRAQWYVPHAQAFETAYVSRRVLSLIVRSGRENPMDLLPSLQARLREVDPRVAQIDARRLDDLRAGSFSLTTLLSRWLLLFAAVALSLAALGFYAAFSFLVSVRRFEFGLRMALGATPRSVLHNLLSEGLRLSIVGLAFGLVVAVLANRAVAGWLFGVAPVDWTVFGLAGLLLGVVGLLATLAPALRASRTGLTAVLRRGG